MELETEGEEEENEVVGDWEGKEENEKREGKQEKERRVLMVGEYMKEEEMVV